LFCPKSEQNAEWEGGSPSVPATSLSAHTRTFFGLNSLSLSGHKWQQQQHQQLLFFLRISNSRHDLDDPSHAERLRQRVCSTDPNPRKDQRPLAPHESPLIAARQTSSLGTLALSRISGNNLVFTRRLHSLVCLVTTSSHAALALSRRPWNNLVSHDGCILSFSLSKETSCLTMLPLSLHLSQISLVFSRRLQSCIPSLKFITRFAQIDSQVSLTLWNFSLLCALLGNVRILVKHLLVELWSNLCGNWLWKIVLLALRRI